MYHRRYDQLRRRLFAGHYGNRRFWPVWVSGESKCRAWELTDIDQIWAEAHVKYAEGEELFLTGDVATAAYAEQRNAMENDDREGLVLE